MKKPCRKSGKIKFDSHEQAAKRAGEIITSDTTAPVLRTYVCPDCGKWHLTSSEPRVLVIDDEPRGFRFDKATRQKVATLEAVLTTRREEGR